jgi:hypothetical protein
VRAFCNHLIVIFICRNILRGNSYFVALRSRCGVVSFTGLGIALDLRPKMGLAGLRGHLRSGGGRFT